MNNEIKEKTSKIVESFKESENYQKYLKVKEKMNHNEEIKKLVDEIKRLQKRIVNHPKEKESLEKQINEILDKLKEIPLYNEFINLQEELNENINYIKSTLDDYFNNILN